MLCDRSYQVPRHQKFQEIIMYCLTNVNWYTDVFEGIDMQIYSDLIKYGILQYIPTIAHARTGFEYN